MMGIVVPQNDFIGPLKKAMTDTTILSLIIIFLAVITVILFSRKVSNPIKLLASDMAKVERFELDHTIEVKTRLQEVAMVAEGFKAMKQGLQSFGRYVPRDLVRQLIESGYKPELGGSKKQRTIMFSDIESFTSISEKMSSEALMLHLSEYLDNLSTIVTQNHGTIAQLLPAKAGRLDNACKAD